jgi:hypothetical protein
MVDAHNNSPVASKTPVGQAPSLSGPSSASTFGTGDEESILSVVSLHLARLCGILIALSSHVARVFLQLNPCD